MISSKGVSLNGIREYVNSSSRMALTTECGRNSEVDLIIVTITRRIWVGSQGGLPDGSFKSEPRNNRSSPPNYVPMFKQPWFATSTRPKIPILDIAKAQEFQQKRLKAIELVRDGSRTTRPHYTSTPPQSPRKQHVVVPVAQTPRSTVTQTSSTRRRR